MKDKKTILNVLYNVIKVGINIIFPMIIFPYVSRVLGPKNIGSVEFATSITAYFGLFASLGIPSYGIIACSKAKKNKEYLSKTVSEIVTLNLIIALFVECIFIFCIIFVDKMRSNAELMILNGIGMLFNIIGLEWFYSAIEKFRYITIRSIFIKLVSLILIFSCVRVKENYIVYAGIIIFGTVGANIFNLIYSRKFVTIKLRFTLDIIKHLKPIMFFFGAAIASTINSYTDSVMLGFLKGDFAVGIYSFSVKIKMLLSSIVTAGLTVLIPQFALLSESNQYSKFREKLRTTFLLTMIIAIGLSFCFVISTNEVIHILGGEQYFDAKYTMIILDLCVIILGVTWSFGVGVLQSTGRENKYALTIVISCIVNVCINIVLIPLLSHTGAAIATLVTELVNMFLFIYYSRDIVLDSLNNIKLFRIIICGLGACGCAIFVSSYFNIKIMFISFILKSLVFFVSYILMVFISNREIRMIIRQVIKCKNIIE